MKEDKEVSIIKGKMPPMLQAMTFSNHAIDMLKCLISEDGIVPYFDLRNDLHREIFECAILNSDLIGGELELIADEDVPLDAVNAEDTPTRAERITHIYLMRNNRNGLTKIGKSIAPKFREKTLQSEEPEISIIFISHLCGESAETNLHEKFSEKRIRGEWFNLNSEDIDFIKNSFITC